MAKKAKPKTKAIVKKKGTLPEVPKFEPKYLKNLPEYPAAAETQLQKGFLSRLRQKVRSKKSVEIPLPGKKPAGKTLPVKGPEVKTKDKTPMYSRPLFHLPTKKKSNKAPTLESFKEVDRINKELEKINREISKIKV